MLEMQRQRGAAAAIVNQGPAEADNLGLRSHERNYDEAGGASSKLSLRAASASTQRTRVMKLTNVGLCGLAFTVFRRLLTTL